MRPKSLLLLTLALGCGLVASIGISQVLDRKGGQGPTGPEMEPIYVAKADINLGDKITAELLNLEDWPKDKIPPGSIRELDHLVGRHPRTKVYQGEPILEAKLVSSDARDNPAEQVPPGFRVVSVRVDASTGGAGLLRPGDRVDVQLFVKKSSRTGVGLTKTKTILREVRVFAVDQYFRREKEDDEASPARTVSLVVTPEQADRLTLATKLGEINLIIRNPDDRGNPSSDGASIEDLFVSTKVDREQERGKEAKASGAGFLDFVKQLGKVAAVSKSQTPNMVAAAPWTVMIMEGSDVRQVQLQQQGDSPVWTSGAGTPLIPGAAGLGPRMTPANPASAADRPAAGHPPVSTGTVPQADAGDQPAPDAGPGLPVFTPGTKDSD